VRCTPVRCTPERCTPMRAPAMRSPMGDARFCEPSSRAGHGGENPYIDPEDVLKLLIVGDSAVRLLVTLGVRSAW
jgi:hypothetical protein